jgi:hypothetical protein
MEIKYHLMDENVKNYYLLRLVSFVNLKEFNMKAFRNVGGNVVEVEIDTDLNGHPILPPDTTTDPRPEAQEGHYVTVVGDKWVQIAIPVPFVTFETKKQDAHKKLKAYRAWYLEQPIIHEGVKFDADEQARARLTQALTINGANGYLPPAWIAFDNTPFPLAAVADLVNLVNAVQVAFSNRFFETAAIRDQIINATTEEQLAAITVPVVPDPFHVQ